MLSQLKAEMIYENEMALGITAPLSNQIAQPMTQAAPVVQSTSFSRNVLAKTSLEDDFDALLKKL